MRWHVEVRCDTLLYGVTMKNAIRIVVIAMALVLGLSSCIILEPLVPAGPSTRPAGGAVDLSTVRVGNNQTVRLDATTYGGTLSIRANNSNLIGAGVGKTIIRGNVEIVGNSNRISGVTIAGTVTIHGNTNDLSGSDVSQAKVVDNGNKNRY